MHVHENGEDSSMESSSKSTDGGLSIAKKVEEKRVVSFQFEANASATKGDQNRTSIRAWKKQARKKVIVNKTDNNIDTRTVKRKNQVSLYIDEGEVDKRIRLALDECTNIERLAEVAWQPCWNYESRLLEHMGIGEHPCIRQTTDAYS